MLVWRELVEECCCCGGGGVVWVEVDWVDWVDWTVVHDEFDGWAQICDRYCKIHYL